MTTRLATEAFSDLRELAHSIQSRLAGGPSTDFAFQNELAGMFAVTISATYEAIVRDALCSYASQFHSKYYDYVADDFSKMNSKISIQDLKTYAKKFGLNRTHVIGVDRTETTFQKVLRTKRALVEPRLRRDVSSSYSSILQWRHAYAHQRQTLATFKDVYENHRAGKYVIWSFAKAFELG